MKLLVVIPLILCLVVFSAAQEMTSPKNAAGPGASPDPSAGGDVPKEDPDAPAADPNDPDTDNDGIPDSQDDDDDDDGIPDTDEDNKNEDASPAENGGARIMLTSGAVYCVVSVLHGLARVF